MVAAYHILNGDALAQQLRQTDLPGRLLVCREALVDGPVSATNADDFFAQRQAFLEAEFGDSQTHYRESVIPEFAAMQEIPDGSSVYLWFEDDLFCQVNMWFVLHWLSGKDLNVFRVFPLVVNEESRWWGFGANDVNQLLEAWQKAIPMDRDARLLGESLWYAFRSGNKKDLAELSQTKAAGFHMLPEVVQAQLDRMNSPSRPETFVRQQIEQGERNFGKVFQAFCREEGIYGFGDLQVKKLFDSLSTGTS